jgi:hypothetical protein
LIENEVFPDLWLKLDSLLNYELAEPIKIVQQGLDIMEHQEFINQSKIKEFNSKSLKGQTTANYAH